MRVDTERFSVSRVSLCITMLFNFRASLLWGVFLYAHWSTYIYITKAEALDTVLTSNLIFIRVSPPRNRICSTDQSELKLPNKKGTVTCTTLATNFVNGLKEVFKILVSCVIIDSSVFSRVSFRSHVVCALQHGISCDVGSKLLGSVDLCVVLPRGSRGVQSTVVPRACRVVCSYYVLRTFAVCVGSTSFTRSLHLAVDCFSQRHFESAYFVLRKDSEIE